MAQTIKLKRSATQNAVPSTSQLELGEVAINTYDGKMYIKKNDGSDSIVEIGGDATSSSGLDFTGNLNLADNVRIVIGDGSDLQIYHDGSDSIINENGTGDLKVFSSRFRVISNSGEEMIRATADGAVDLYHNNSAKFATTSAGATVSGSLTVQAGDAGTSDYSVTSNGGDLVLKAGADDVVLRTGGSGTEGIYFQDGAQDTKMFINAENGTVGIGTTSPTSELQVGDGTTNATIKAYYSDNTYAELAGYGVQFNRSTSYLRPTTNGDKQLEIGGSTLNWNKIINWADTSFLFSGGGNVGINETAPAHKLEVSGDGHLIRATGTTSGGSARIGVYNENDGSGNVGALVYMESSGWGEGFVYVGGHNISAAGGDFNIRAASGADLTFGNGTTEYARISGSGNFGIGTTSPSSLLHLESASSPALQIKDTTQNVTFKAYAQDSNTHLANTSNHDLVIDTNNTERMRILAGGNVGIGTDSPSETLEVVGDILIHNGVDSTLYLGKGAEGVDGVTKIKSVQTGSDTDQLGLAFNVHSSTAGSAVSEEAMRIDHDGNLLIGNTTAGAKLDIRQDSGYAIRAENSSGHYFRVAAGGAVEVGGSAFVDASRNITSANITTTGYLRGPSTFTIDPATHGDDTGTVVIAGNLQVDGTTTTINSTTLTVDDKNITLASGSTNDAAADGAGLTIDCGSNTDVTFNYSGSDRRMSLSHPLKIFDPASRTIAGSNASNGWLQVGTTLSMDDNEIYFSTEGYFGTLGSNPLNIRTNGSTKMYITAAGDVGIGTTSPGEKLSIGSGSILLDNDYSIGWGDNSTRINGSGSGERIIFTTSTSERLRIDASGNILHQSGSPEYHFGTTSASHYNWRVAVQEAVDAGFEIASGTQSAGSGALSDTYTTRFVIKGDTGNVGIGTNSPSYKLHVLESSTPVAKFEGATNAYIDFTDGSVQTRFQNSGGFFLGTQTNHDVALKTNGSVKVMLKSDGRLGISTTTPEAKLHTIGHSRLDGAVLQKSGSGITSANISTDNEYISHNGPVLTNGSTANINQYGYFRGYQAVYGTDGTNGFNPYAQGAYSKPVFEFISNNRGSISLPTDAAIRDGYLYQFVLGNNGGGTNSGVELTSSNTTVLWGITSSNHAYFANNVGIGTATPAADLDIAGTLASPPTLRLSNTTTAFTQGDNVGQIEFHHADTTDFTPGVFGIIRGVAGASGGEGSIQVLTNMPSEGTDANDVAIEFTGAGAVKISDAFTLPTSDGSGNQVLQTDGSGNVSWATISGVGTATEIADADGDTKIQVEESADEDVIRFDTAGSQRMVIDSGGNFGFGVDTPTSYFHVKKNSTGIIARIEGTSGRYLYTGTDSLGHYLEQVGTSATDRVFRIQNSNGSGQYTQLKFDGHNQRIYTNSGTNVGIGTSAPASNLHVKTSVDNSFSQGIVVERSLNSDRGYINYSGGAFQFRSTVGDPIVFGETDAEHLRILPDGNVGIGTTNPGQKLDVVGTIQSSVGLRVAGHPVVGYSSITGGYAANLGSTGTSTLNETHIYSGGTQRVVIDGSGNVGIGTTTPDEFSIGGAYKYLAVGGDKPGIINLVDSGTAGSYLQFGTAAGVRRSSIHTDSNSDVAITLNSSNSGTGLTERFRIKASNGNVGIGTASPVEKLSIGGGRDINFHIGGHKLITFCWAPGNSNNATVAGKPAEIRHEPSSGKLRFAVDGTSRSVGDTVSLATILTLQNGRAGIGNDNPVAKLQVEELGIDTTTTTTSATTQVAIDTMAAATFRSAEFTIQVTNSTDSTYHLTKVLLIHDGTTPGITEYGTVFTGSAAEATFDADISSGNVRLLATPASTDSMTFKVVRHCITV